MTFRQKIESRQFVLCGEIGPPRSCHAAFLREHVLYFKGFVDALNITDNQRAMVRLSSIASAKILLDEGVEPIMQMTCRDRNRLAIQSDLLGAAALGIQNVLCLTGDHQSCGDHPEARGVFDLDSIQLIAAVAGMNEGRLLSGYSMKHAPAFFIGAAANPFAEPLEMRIIRLAKKISAGARFIQTQPVFDLPRFLNWMKRIVDQGLHEQTAILAGVMPVRSVKTLVWMKNELPGMRIQEEYIRRMSSARDPEEEGIAIAGELIQSLKTIMGVQGIHLMPSLWESVVPRIARESGCVPTT